MKLSDFNKHGMTNLTKALKKATNAPIYAMMLLTATCFAQAGRPISTTPVPAAAPATLSPAQQDLVHAVEQYVLEKTTHLNGDVSIHVVLPSREPPSCDTLSVALPVGKQITSRTTLEVTCLGRPEVPVSFVRADVKVEGEYFVPNQVIEMNRVITADLLQAQTGDLLRLPEGAQADINSLIGRTAAQRLPAGRPIKISATRGVDAIARGQIVQIQATAPGFVVTNQGEAITSAEVGAPIQVKTAQGKVVRGIVKEGGVVEVLM
jgi:flagella basal body P-ring formation protein FlgA